MHDNVLRVFKWTVDHYRGFIQCDDGNIGMYISSIKDSLEAIECTKIEKNLRIALSAKLKSGKIVKLEY